MKICKNHFDILIKPVSKCAQCALKMSTRPYLWLRVTYVNTLDCGGIRSYFLSDIFKL